MADPTQANRDAIKGFFNKIIPDNSPLAQSGDDVLTPEARAKMEADAAAARAPADLQQVPVEQAPTDFVNPVQAQPVVANATVVPAAPILNPLATYTKGANVEADAIAKQGQQEALAIQAGIDKNAEHERKLLELQDQEAKLTEDFAKQDEETSNKIKNFELKPKNFFAGKNTWQKILGGVGMFLGSMTPEGARNIASIIDKEIDRDLDIQRNQLALMKDAKSEAAERYKLKLDQFGSAKLARMSMKKDALEMVKLQLDQIASSAKGDMARGAALKGRATVEQAQNQLTASLMKEYLKNNQGAVKGSLPGYEGANQNPTIVKELTDRLTAQKSANQAIDQLDGLLKDGALFGKNKAIAEQVREKLAADLAKAMFGRSSDSELQVARDLIPDITSMTQRGSVDKTLLKNLKQKLSQDMDAAASAAGYKKSIPLGARKI